MPIPMSDILHAAGRRPSDRSGLKAGDNVAEAASEIRGIRIAEENTVSEASVDNDHVGLWESKGIRILGGHSPLPLS